MLGNSTSMCAPCEPFLEESSSIMKLNQNRDRLNHNDRQVIDGLKNGLKDFNRVFHYKPSILGYPYFWKPPWHSFCFPNVWRPSSSRDKARPTSRTVWWRTYCSPGNDFDVDRDDLENLKISTRCILCRI